MERTQIATGYSVSRVIRGGWQLAGGHGPVDGARALDDLLAAFDAGMTTFDGADIYTGVEALFGRLLQRVVNERGAEAAARLRLHTKCVPDLASLSTVRRGDIEALIDASRRRLGVKRLDLVQFHWWDHHVPRHVEVAGWLAELARDGRIELLGGTNFGTAGLGAMLDAGVPIRTMQVQYSLIDRRPEDAMTSLASGHDIHLFAYGTVAGGFLSERWLGVPEPEGAALENRSLVKYKLVIDDAGGWDALQALLEVLKRVADEKESDIATVASRAVLERPRVAAVIVGARSRAHLAANVALGALRLDRMQLATIETAARELVPLEGDVYDLERDRSGRHGAIMRYNLNADAA